MDSGGDSKVLGNSGNKIWQGNQPIFIPIPAEFRWDLNSVGMVPGMELGMAGTESVIHCTMFALCHVTYHMIAHSR